MLETNCLGVSSCDKEIYFRIHSLLWLRLADVALIGSLRRTVVRRRYNACKSIGTCLSISPIVDKDAFAGTPARNGSGFRDC